ncbi:DNA-binding protein [Mycobacteroides abscessus subsp. abscessus]|uniref:helix-turn-helix domain-containing protein n=1 Tax=Mycobacteroides abscessus TaxID=36809 RepID=UPI00092BE5BE|nr:helix-turn-helix domain-containing protein [Mycobacteroides abscessus]SHP29513.1 DNA-binding protein [Mycobacteroides abscessus subsp. abscessus]SHP69948.1 DNA-binding protein [Mycobacteroides abscessus subsp. abscessus]SHY39766.1 DNA-binding protein [Mycobacteroides abscessus subsp. abscessus]SKD92602.1 DNA-binding protein [Mycobacteroides abscessus subsp. abscessus]
MSTNNELAAAIAALLAAAQTTPAEAASSPATLLTAAETAERLRCGQTMVYQLIKDGRLASVKIGRRRLVRASAVEEFIQRGGAAAA